MANVYILAHARSDENHWDGYEGSIPGDQTGLEICLNTYDEVKSIGFTRVIRWKEEYQHCAKAFSIRMWQTADNDNYGYSQPNRGTGWAAMREQIDPSKIKKKVEGDCSQIVNTNARNTIESCGMPANGITGLEVTATMIPILLNSGYFEDATSKVNLSNGDGLQISDILVRPGVHTAAVIDVKKSVKAATPSGKIGTVKGCVTLTVRQGPGTEYKPCGIDRGDGKGLRTYLERGEKVEIHDSSIAYWYQLKITDPQSGITQYPFVSKKFIA